jgi:DNA ligase-4
MLPHKDRERTMYGLKEKSIAKTYIKLIPLGNKDPDAIRLMNWKKPTEKEVRLCFSFDMISGLERNSQKSSGDFPTVLYEVISKRSSVVLGSLTVQELNDLLDELSENDKKMLAKNMKCLLSCSLKSVQRCTGSYTSKSIQSLNAGGAAMDRAYHSQR